MNMTLEEIAAPVELGSVDFNGKRYAIRPMDGYGYHLSQSANGDAQVSIEVTYKLAARAIGVTFEDLFGTENTVGMPLPDAARIVAIASGRIRAVEETASPLSEPAGETATG